MAARTQPRLLLIMQPTTAVLDRASRWRPFHSSGGPGSRPPRAGWRQQQQQQQQQQQRHHRWCSMSVKRSTPGEARDGGRITDFDEDDWFLPLHLPFKVKHHAASKRQKPWKRVKQIIAAERYELLPASTPTYVNIEAPPSVYPAKRYCDLTGMPAPYTEPKTKLRYASADLFPLIRSLAPDAVQQYLAVRNAQVVLK